jgi:Flp pilus assembly protein TadG
MTYLPSSRRRPRRGAIAVWVAICLALLLGVAALAVDGGLLMVDRRRAQEAADAAALAAAVDLALNYGSVTAANPTGGTSAVTDGQAVGNANFPGASSVQVNIPPTSGNFTDTSKYLGYVEVIVTYQQKRAFSAIFGSGDVTVTARAVAHGAYGSSFVNILVLDSGASGALTLGGTGTQISVPGTIIVDSNSSKALTGNGGATAVSGSGISVDGGIDKNANVYSPVSGSTTDVLANDGQYIDDPLGPRGVNLAVPSTSGMTVWSTTTLQVKNGQNLTLKAGIYQGGINIQAGGQATLVPDSNGNNIFYLEGGGLSMNSPSSSLTGTGVMIYNGETNGATNAPSSVGPINISSGVVQLSAPTTGTYTGISIFQDRNATAQLTLTGGGGTNVTGAIYAAGAPAKIAGGSNIVPGAAFITNTLTIQGGSAFTLPQSTILAPNPAVHDVRLVE